MSFVEKYDSLEDFPWFLLYKDIDQKFPGSKFILTRRKNAEVWYESYCKWADKFSPKIVLRLRRHIYGHENPKQHKEDYLRAYHTHNTVVREYFKDKPNQLQPNQLLELCWGEHDWQELCAFLDVKAPITPLPHLNSSLNRI